MISIKNIHELETMRKAGIIAAEALKLTGDSLKPGITTLEVDKIAHQFITQKGGKAAFLGYNGFPASICISINEEVIHGIPSNRKILSGDIVSIDLGVELKGFFADTAATFPIGDISPKALALIQTTKQCLNAAIAKMLEGNRIGDISHAVQNCAETQGFSVVKDFVGHGIGKKLHEPPEIPNYGKAGYGGRISNGMTFAIEPMINEDSHAVEILDDGWTVITKDKSLSAHFEHTVAATPNGPLVLTALEE